MSGGCVTEEAAYQSNAEGIAKVAPSGLVSVRDVPGEAGIRRTFDARNVPSTSWGQHVRQCHLYY